MKTLRWVTVQSLQDGQRLNHPQAVKYDGRDAQLLVNVNGDVSVTIRKERGRLIITPIGNEPLWVDAAGAEIRATAGGSLEVY